MQSNSSLSKSAIWFLVVAGALWAFAVLIVVVRALYHFFFDHPMLFRVGFIGLNVLFVLACLVATVFGFLAPDARRGNRAALAALALLVLGECVLWTAFATWRYPE